MVCEMLGLSELRPTTDELRDWLLHTLRHSCHVEYYLHAFSLGKDDPQRPHDISGHCNKYCGPVAFGLALQHRGEDEGNGFTVYSDHVIPAIQMHRRNQHHHQMFNSRDSNHTDDDMRVGAIDALCSLLEDRQYQGGEHSLDNLLPIIKKAAPHKIRWMWQEYLQMCKITKPDLKRIVSLDDAPNIGLPKSIHDKIILATFCAVETFREYYGYKDL